MNFINNSIVIINLVKRFRIFIVGYLNLLQKINVAWWHLSEPEPQVDL